MSLSLFLLFSFCILQKVAFKVKTTAPRRYLVRPNQGIFVCAFLYTITKAIEGLIDSASHAEVQIIMQAKACNGLIMDGGNNDEEEDKFLVQV